MNVKMSIIAVSLSAGLVGPSIAETVVLTEPEVRTIVVEKGYAKPDLVVKKGELWQVTSSSDSGGKVMLYVTPDKEVMGPAAVINGYDVQLTNRVAEPLTKLSVETILIEAGFHNVHDIEEKDSVWKAEADDISGDDYEIHVDRTGKIVHIEDD